MIVYLLKQNNSDLYKIGKTTRKGINRKKECQTGNGNILEVIYEFESEYMNQIEIALHNYFKSYNTIGEWYEFPPDIVLKFKDICNKIEKNLLYLDQNKI